MPRRARVLRCVTVGRVVATMRAAALLTGTEMNPGCADLDALLAFPSFRVLDAGDSVNVDATLIGHGTLYGRSGDSSHVAMRSQPAFVIDVIREAAKAVRVASATV